MSLEIKPVSEFFPFKAGVKFSFRDEGEKTNYLINGMPSNWNMEVDYLNPNLKDQVFKVLKIVNGPDMKPDFMNVILINEAEEEIGDEVKTIPTLGSEWNQFYKIVK